MKTLFPTSGSATFSPCQRFRYTLVRELGDGPTINFLMLNPSTANAEVSDPTVTRCLCRARSGRFGRLIVTNLFAWRSTDPQQLYSLEDRIGPGNDAAILDVAAGSDVVVLAWGNHGVIGGRGDKVIAKLLVAGHGPRLHKLGGLTGLGQPRHPLYVSYAVVPTRVG